LLRGRPHRADQLWRDGACCPRGVPRTRGRPEAGLCLRAALGVQREESQRPGSVGWKSKAGAYPQQNGVE
jgi:hypothetical protein